MMKKTDYELIRDYFAKNLPRVMKEPHDCFAHPFIDPGSIYEGNLWDWDTFWTVYAMANVVDDAFMGPEFRQKFEEHAKGNVLNFLSFQMEDGYIPMMVSADYFGEQEPYLLAKHRQGQVLNMHKPFLCQQACLVSGIAGSYDWILGRLPQLERYFECYDRYYYNSRCGLYVWADDVMIGMDNDPASFGRPRFSTANIFLNSFMVKELRSMAQLLTKAGDESCAAHYQQKAKALCAAIQAECWDKRDKFFYSVDVDIKTRGYDWFHKGLGVFWNTLFLKTRAWSSFLPLYIGLANGEQAAHLAKHITDPETFWSPYGVRSLSRDEKMYSLEATNNPSNWLGPIWIIAQYLVFRGLRIYKFEAEARELANRVLKLLGDDLRATGTLHEYYIPETGAPVMSPGFMNWNILALNMADELNGKPSIDDFLPFDFYRGE